MQKMHLFIKKTVITVVDFFYPPFSKIMNLQTFRYAACGGANTSLDIFLFFISYNFILNKEVMNLSFITISPHIAAFLIAFCVTFPLGFYLMKFVVFSESNLRGRVQLIRYLLLVFTCLFLNYFFIKLFVEYLHIFPTPAKIFTTVIVVGFSYLTQKHFTFKIKAADNL
jgi:putative flippase GtrA